MELHNQTATVSDSVAVIVASIHSGAQPAPPTRPVQTPARRSTTSLRQPRTASSDPSCQPWSASRCPLYVVDTISCGYRPSERPQRTCVDAPTNTSIFFVTIGHMIRCSCVSGLEVAACQTPRALMEICRSCPVRIPALGGASSGILVLPTRSRDRLPLRSSVLLTSSATNRWV